MAEKLLLVEDDADQAALYAQVLEASGYQVVTAATAEDAQARLTAEPVALLLVDWDLGRGMKGDAFIAWAHERDPGVKSALISNHYGVDALADACGADAAFRKMDGIIALRQLVARLLAPDAG